MEHVVFFPASDGSPAFRRLPSVEEAVRLVEHLRNVEGVDRVSVHALTEVPLAFRAYYRVELPPPARPATAAPALEPEPVLDAVPARSVASLPAEPEPVQPPAADAAPEPVPALALVDLPEQAGEPDPVRLPSSSLGFFA